MRVCVSNTPHCSFLTDASSKTAPYIGGGIAAAVVVVAVVVGIVLLRKYLGEQRELRFLRYNVLELLQFHLLSSCEKKKKEKKGVLS